MICTGDHTTIFKQKYSIFLPLLLFMWNCWDGKKSVVFDIWFWIFLGDTLEAELQRRMLFDPIMVLQMMTDVLDAVDFLHSHGIIYLYWSCK